MSVPQRGNHLRNDLFDRARQVSVLDVDGVGVCAGPVRGV